MLNLGQLVYDSTNKRVMVFAGLEMLRNERTGNCHSETAFILKDGTFIHLKAGEEIPFKYTNINMNGKPFIGTFVTNCRCEGYFLGIIDGYDAEVKAWAKEAIEEIEVLITKHGLKVTNEVLEGKNYAKHHIGEPVIRKAASCQKK